MKIGDWFRKLDVATIERAIAMYNDGLSVQAVAKEIGVTRSSLWQSLKRRGVKMRPQLRFGADNHFHRAGNVHDERAHDMVEKAVLRGRLKRPQACETCRGPGEPFADGRAPIQAHHDDYNKPLDVRWLCQRCHHAWHKVNVPLARRACA